jgi:hypothetical protein
MRAGAEGYIFVTLSKIVNTVIGSLRATAVGVGSSRCCANDAARGVAR